MPNGRIALRLLLATFACIFVLACWLTLRAWLTNSLGSPLFLIYEDCCHRLSLWANAELFCS